MVAGRRFLLRQPRMTISTLLAPAQWAQTEFALAELGDRRRTQRLVKMASALAQSPGGTLPQAFPNWKDLKAAYRFLSQPQASYERILTPHWARTRRACQEPGEYLLLEDTTELDYTGHGATEDLGFIGDGRGRGLLLHSTLAVRVEAWTLEQRPEGTVLGLLGQQCWTRQGSPGKRRRETWRQRVKRPRESQRWARVVEEVGGPPAGSGFSARIGRPISTSPSNGASATGWTSSSGATGTGRWWTRPNISKRRWPRRRCGAR
jgi:hypothetical protein